MSVLNHESIRTNTNNFYYDTFHINNKNLFLFDKIFYFNQHRTQLNNLLLGKPFEVSNILFPLTLSKSMSSFLSVRFIDYKKTELLFKKCMKLFNIHLIESLESMNQLYFKIHPNSPNVTMLNILDTHFLESN